MSGLDGARPTSLLAALRVTMLHVLLLLSTPSLLPQLAEVGERMNESAVLA